MYIFAKIQAILLIDTHIFAFFNQFYEKNGINFSLIGEFQSISQKTNLKL